jgi:activator of HSP90 ATPase
LQPVLLGSGGKAFALQEKERPFMTTRLFTRRDFSVRLASILPTLGIAGTAALASAAVAAQDAHAGEISRAAESIHQELVFKASRKQVYEAILDEKQFSKMTGLAAQVNREAGGAFSCFEGQIKGRNVELVPNEWIVQAWRSEGWKAGIYSIAKFVLVEQGSGTKIVFDHTGFPVGQAEHLVSGWQEHYWSALATRV